MALPLSLLSGGLVAALTWWTWQPVYMAAAYLRVASRQPVVMFNTAEVQGQPTYEIYKRTQRELIRNRFVLNSALSNPLVKEVPLVQQQLDPVAWLQEKIAISYPGDAEVLEISIRAESPEWSAVIVNAICDAYVEEVVNTERNDRFARVQSLEKIRDDTDEKIRQHRTELRLLTETLGTGDSHAVTVKQELAIENHGAIRRQQQNVQFELIRAESMLAAQQARLDAIEQMELPPDTVDEYLQLMPEYAAAANVVQRESAILKSFESVTRQARELHKRRNNLEWARETLEKLEAMLRPIAESEVRKLVTHQLRTDIDATTLNVETLRAQSDHLARELAKIGDEALQIGRSSVDLEMKRDELTNVERIRNQLGQEIESLRVELASSARVEVISRAEAPKTQDTKARTRQAITYGGAALLMPLFLICWWDTRRQKVNSAVDVTAMSRLPLIGTLPMLPARVQSRSHRAGETVLWDRIMRESIDAAREMLISERRSRPIQSVLVTSAVGGEGKTTIACQLAMSFARMGKRTVLVDLDLRRPSTHLVINGTLGTGMADLLRADATLAEIMQPSDHPNLCYISAGAIDEESPQVLCLRRDLVQSTISRLREQFEVVVVDSCPVLLCVDTLIIGQFVDAALVAVMRDVSQSAEVQLAQESLERMGISVLGAVVTSNESKVYHSRYKYDRYLKLEQQLN